MPMTQREVQELIDFENSVLISYQRHDQNDGRRPPGRDVC
jgi:hypothetical protein